MKHHPFAKWARTGLIAAAAGALALVGVALPAHAATPGNIDDTAARSLTIHKYEQPDSGDLGNNDGTEIVVPAGATPLAGVVFSVQQVTDIDLLTTAGWTAAEALTVAQAQAGNLGTDVGGATLADGTLTIAGLDIGLYLVQETGVTADGPDNIVAPAQPFLVAVPQPMGSGDWNYNVHVYPKNTLQDAPVKTVDDGAAYAIGDTISWGVSIDVPVLSQGTSYNSYVISDTLVAELGFSALTLSFVNGATTTPLVDTTHYTLAAPAVGASGTVTATLTAAGLALLNGATGPGEITGTVSTTVLSIGNGTITNQFTVNVNGKPTVSNIPESTWGALKIVKHGAGNTSATLQGATFSLYTNSGTVAAPAKGTLIEADLTTGTDGAILVEGLKTGEYVLEETAAPAGYQLRTDLISVTIVTGTVASPNLYNVANTQVPPYELPLTGGSGTVAFTVLGLALIAFAGGAFVVARKRRTADAEH